MSTGWLKVTILGCGSSGGVPRIDGDWGACDPHDLRNRRTRCGLLVQRWASADQQGDPTTVLVDTSPDLREQLIKAGVTRIDAILYTHDHADQTHGIDDVRAIVYRQGARIPAWMDQATSANLTARFAYIFQSAPNSGYPALLDAKVMPAIGQTVTVTGPGGDVTALVMAQQHGNIASLGFRFGPVAYCNDASDLPPETLAACRGSRLMIVDALRYKPHPSHAHVDQAVAWIRAVGPERAVLTNLHIDLDYAKLADELPCGVEPAIDGWSWEDFDDALSAAS
jgi:phosphoribosyl 1,2-cyclic phosphate phosphodiesterase